MKYIQLVVYAVSAVYLTACIWELGLRIGEGIVP